MIPVLLAVFSSACSVSQSAFTKAASAKSQTPFKFNVFKLGAALVLFAIVASFDFKFHLPTLLYASAYGLLLFFSSLFGYLALKNGSMALSSLIVSFSVILPWLFGVTFLRESVTLLQILGILLLLASMVMINKKIEGMKFKKLWYLYVAITFLCNGLCSVIQKFHQTAYPESYVNEFTLFSVTVSFVLFALIALSREYKPKETKKLPAMLSGVLMGMANYLTLLLASKVDATVLFPMISVFSMLLNLLVSRIYFKDKFRNLQLLGIGLGVLSVLLIK